MKVHVVDGTFELFRCYFGAPKALLPNGVEVGATRGILRTLLSLLRQDDVTHVGVAFDYIIESFRNELFDGYKTSDGIPPDLWSQFRLAERAAAALGVVVWPMVEFEADDALATAAARADRDPNVEQVVICATDKDLTQCVRGTRVVCFDRMRRRLFDEAGVIAKFGVPPASIPDWLALVGDSADGYPGIPGWGAKSAAAILAHYKHIEEIPNDERQWRVAIRGAAGLAAALREHHDELALYRRLATLRTDAPITEDTEDLRWLGAPRTQLVDFCREIGDEQFPEQIHRWRE
ncbi:MAG TPA: 5'-3' exonuclease H3TH domain-containing protein [Gemmatimonadaceae bacterium]|nr:5'-3' exonuclease H3TH domain-containing protein [Gemmatimonadaceae bacterium]